jgi:SAM-dependent methyltransferase
MKFVDQGLKFFSIDKFRYTHLFTLLKGTSDANILELGCGSGVISRYLSRKNKVWAIDKENYSHFFRNHPNVNFLLHDLEAPYLPFKSGVFDKVLAIEVLEHVLRPSKLVKEVHRILKPNGEFLVEVPNWSWNLFSRLVWICYLILTPIRRLIQPRLKKVYKLEQDFKLKSLLTKLIYLINLHFNVAVYSERSHVHKHGWRWWERRLSARFRVIYAKGLHLFPFLSFIPLTFQKRIYAYEQQNQNLLVRTFSSLCFFLLKKYEMAFD